MEAFREAGVRTTCFISPIFPGITDVPAIIERASEHCNLIWLENLNLRGGFKKTIMDYIAESHPELLPLYQAIYNKKDDTYWDELDKEIEAYAESVGLEYVVNDDSMNRPFDAPPIVVNYFHHDKIKKMSTKRSE